MPGCAGDPATTAATTLGPMAIEALAKIPQLAHDQAALAQASAAAHTSGTTIIKATHATIIVKDGKATVIPRHTTPSS